jgi:biotin carboxyl carrier protein
LTTVEPDDQGKTARIEPPAHAATPSPDSTPPAATPPPDASEPPAAEPAPAQVPKEEQARPTAASFIESPAAGVVTGVARAQEVVFVPLAVNVGDGFKFGCGFFLALVLAMLIGFVLLAALFVLTSLFGLNLPISR